MRIVWVGPLAFAAVAFALASCASDSYTAADGTETGPCFPNGTCNIGLDCLSNRCVRSDSADGGSSGDADASTTSDAPASTPDASSDAAEAATVGTCAPPASAPLLQCEDNGNLVTCSGLQHCCVDDNTACTTTSCGTRTMECLSEASCATGEVCCAEVGSITAIGCPAIISSFTGSHCAAVCTQAELTLCFASASCGQAQSCDPAVLSVDYRNDGSVTKFKVGVCK